MKVMQRFNLAVALLLLLLASGSCLADSNRREQTGLQAPDQPEAAASENGAKNGANVVDKSQNKRGAPAIPVIIGTPAQHQQTAYINQHVAGATVVATPISGHATALSAVPFAAYGHHAVTGSTGHILQAASAAPQYNYAAVPQLTYAHYPQYQLYHQQHHPGQQQQQHQQQSTGLTHEYAHPIAATIHELAQHQQQQQTAYAHQQPIYAHHPATAIHYAVPATLVSGQHNYHGQQQLQQQQQYPLTHTQAIHYQQQAVVGGQPSVPIVHQAPIATINQVHQAQQIYAAQGQLTKYPVSGQSLVYGAGGLQQQQQQNQIYSTAPSYGYQQQQHRPAGSSPVGSQILPTIATPTQLQLKSLVPVTTASSTQHHNNGISYSTFTHPGLAQLRPVNPQGVLQTQPVYYNAAVASNSLQQQQQQQQQQSTSYLRTPIQLQQQQQQQQQRLPVYSTVATPLQKSGHPFSHPVPQYPAYAFGQQSTAAGLISGGPLYHHHHHQQQQQQPSAGSNARLTYTNVPTVSIGGAGGGRGSIYLLH